MAWADVEAVRREWGQGVHHSKRSFIFLCVFVYRGVLRFYMKQVLGIQKSLKTTNLPKHPYDVIFTFPLTSQPMYAPSPEAAHKFRQLLTARFQLTTRNKLFSLTPSTLGPNLLLRIMQNKYHLLSIWKFFRFPSHFSTFYLSHTTLDTLHSVYFNLELNATYQGKSCLWGKHI